MGRHKKVSVEKENGTTIAVVEKSKGQEAYKREWLPFEGRDKLPACNTTIKERVVHLTNGTEHTESYAIVKDGEPRYEVTRDGVLLKWLRGYGGVQRRFVYQFKTKYRSDSPESKERKKKDETFRNELRAAGVPGA